MNSNVKVRIEVENLKEIAEVTDDAIKKADKLKQALKELNVFNDEITVTNPTQGTDLKDIERNLVECLKNVTAGAKRVWNVQTPVTINGYIDALHKIKELKANENETAIVNIEKNSNGEPIKIMVGDYTFDSEGVNKKEMISYKESKELIEYLTMDMAKTIFEEAKATSKTVSELSEKIETTLKKEFGGTGIMFPVGSVVQNYIREMKANMEVEIK